MTSTLVTCTVRDTILDAARLMDAWDLGWLPVIDGPGTRTLLGVLTDRDLILRAVARGLDPDRNAVEEVMTWSPVTGKERDDAQAALDAMGRHQVRRLPVLDADDRLVGVIAQADIVTLCPDARRVIDFLTKISRPTLVHPSMDIRR